MNFLGVGAGELLLILVIAMMVVGPERMVELSRQLGRTLAKFREQSESITREFKEAFSLELDEDAEAAGSEAPAGSATAEAPPAAPAGDGQAAEEAAEVTEAPAPSPEEVAALEAARLAQRLAEDMVDGEVEVVQRGVLAEGDGAGDGVEDDAYREIEPVCLPLASIVPEDQDVEPTPVSDLLVVTDEDVSAELPVEGEE